MSIHEPLLLIRHAETDAAGSFCGHSDPPVNDRGMAQIEKLVAELMPYQIDVVYTSDLKRARTTAEVIATACSAPLRILPDLREIHFGDWERLNWQQIESKDAVYAKRWIAEFPTLSAPNGEAFHSFETRVLKQIDAIAAANQRAAIVTHAGVLRVILTQRCGLTNEEAWKRTIPHCGVIPYLQGEGSTR